MSVRVNRCATKRETQTRSDAMRCDSSAWVNNERPLFLEDGWMKLAGPYKYVTSRSCDAEALRHASHWDGAPIRGATRHSASAYRHVMLSIDPGLGASVAQLCPALVAEPAIFILFTPSST